MKSMNRLVCFFTFFLVILSSSLFPSFQGQENILSSESEKNDIQIVRIDLQDDAFSLSSVGNSVLVIPDFADSSLRVPGQPVLPVYSQVMTFPLGTKILDVHCDFSSYETIQLSKKIVLTPSVLSFGGMYERFFNRASSMDINLGKGLYPSENFTYHLGSGLKDDAHVLFLSLKIFPIRYDAESVQLRCTKNITIAVTYSSQELFPTSLEETYDLLIVSPSEFSENLMPLVNHKNNYNLSTKLVNLEEINGLGRDKPEQIKYFIKNAIEQWGISSVLLVGNEEKLPGRYTHVRDASSSLHARVPFVTDLYYADVYDANGSFCNWDANQNDEFGEITYNRFYGTTLNLDKTDLYPDVHIGRLLCGNTSAVDTVVNKIIEYERSKADPSWFDNLILFGGNDFSLRLELLRLYFGIVIDDYENFSLRPSFEGEYLCNKVEEVMTDFTAKKFYGSAVIPAFKKYNNADIPSVENVNNAINEGAGFLIFAGHGNTQVIAAGFPLANKVVSYLYNSSNIKDLENKEKLPIVMMGGCSCGDFSNTTGSLSPIAWEFVSHPFGGSIASFAYSSNVWVNIGSQFTDSKGGYMMYTLFKAYATGNDTTGKMWSASVNEYMNDEDAFQEMYGEEYLHFATIQELTLFGDPTLKIGGY